MPQMKLFGNSHDPPRVSQASANRSEQAPKEKKQKKKKPLKVLAVWLTVIYVWKACTSSAATRTMPRRKMAHDLHPDCNVHHAPPVAGNVSAAGVGGRRCHGASAPSRWKRSATRSPPGAQSQRTQRPPHPKSRRSSRFGHRGHGASDRDHDARRRAGAGEGSVLRTVLGAGPTDDGGVC